MNGKPISQKLFEEYAQALARRPLSELTPEDREQIKENLVRVVLIAQEAEKSGLLNDPDVSTRLELAKLELLQQATAQKYMKDHTPTEAEMRAEFEAQIASAPLVEFQARHILVSSEDVAMKIIAQLKAGNDFVAHGQAHVGRQGVRGERRRPRLVRPARHGSGVHQRRGDAEEGRIHQDPGADRGRLARDPVDEHARSCAARVRRRERPPGEDRGGQAVQDALGRDAQDREGRTGADHDAGAGAAPAPAPAPRARSRAAAAPAEPAKN